MEKEQKTDLRFQKTEQAIRETFFELRKTLPIEKVKVRPLCQRAMVNTSTFYAHYKDIVELSDIWENELIEKCMPKQEDMACFFSDPYRFIVSLKNNATACWEELTVLFGGRTEVLHQKLEKKLEEHFDINPASENGIKFSFALGGLIHTIHMPSEKTEPLPDQLCQILASLILKL